MSFRVSSGSILQSFFFVIFFVNKSMWSSYSSMRSSVWRFSTARKVMSSVLLHGQDGLLLFPTVLGLWRSYCSVRKMSWVDDLIWWSFLFLVADQTVGRTTMAARRRQHGHRHGRRVLQRLGRFWDFTKSPESREDMGAERASKVVLAPTMATGRPRQQCANFWNSTSLLAPVKQGFRPQCRRRSVATIGQGCRNVVSGCVLFVQM